MKIHKNCVIGIIQNECCSITTRKAVMSELNLVKVQCVSVKLLTIFHNKKCAKSITFKMSVVV